MLYKTIALALIQEEPQLHKMLRRRREVLPAMEDLAWRLRLGHEEWIQAIGRKRPDSDSRRISGEALEFAIESLRDHLRAASTSSAAAIPLAWSIPSATRPTPPA